MAQIPRQGGRQGPRAKKWRSGSASKKLHLNVSGKRRKPRVGETGVAALEDRERFRYFPLLPAPTAVAARPFSLGASFIDSQCSPF